MAQLHKGKKVDIHAVARRANVSASTVSRFFNHPELVRAPTRKKIAEACDSLGYIRNRGANTLRGLRSGTIGLVLPTADNAIFAELIQAFSDELGSRDLTLLISTHGYDLDLETKLVRTLMEHGVDGIGVIGLEHSDLTKALFRSQNIPCVTMWNYAMDSETSCVGPENFEAGKRIADYVVELGHREIATFFPELAGNDRARERMSGVLASCEKAGVKLSPDKVFTTPYSISSAKIAALELLRQEDRPSAVICGNDIIARGVIYAAQALNIRIPQELSVAGIGDFKGSAEMEPGLTSIRMPARRIGQVGAQVLIRNIENRGGNEIVRQRFELSLMKRRSTGVWAG